MQNHKTLFSVAAAILFLYGLMWFLVPDVGLRLHGHTGVQVNDLASVIARFWGSAFVGSAVILWFGRGGQSDSIGVRAIIYGGFVLALTGLVAALIDAFTANPNGLIWLSVALYALFSLWFGYLAFIKKPV